MSSSWEMSESDEWVATVVIPEGVADLHIACRQGVDLMELKIDQSDWPLVSIDIFDPDGNVLIRGITLQAVSTG